MAEQSRESGGIITEEQIAESIERIRATKGDHVIPKREADGYRALLHAGERITPGRDLTVAVNVDVSDALTGLKALRREADAAVRSLRSIERIAGVKLLHSEHGEGEWEHGSYAHGIYNGMEYVIAAIEGRSPEFKVAE